MRTGIAVYCFTVVAAWSRWLRHRILSASTSQNTCFVLKASSTGASAPACPADLAQLPAGVQP